MAGEPLGQVWKLDENTPLIDVIPLLPREVCAELFELDDAARRLFLTFMRMLISSMEERGLTLDPVSFDIVVSTMSILVKRIIAMVDIQPMEEMMQRILEEGDGEWL